jgi:hypothetical protein
MGVGEVERRVDVDQLSTRKFTSAAKDQLHKLDANKHDHHHYSLIYELIILRNYSQLQMALL